MVPLYYFVIRRMRKQRFVGSGESWLKSYTGAGNGMEQLWRNSNIYFYLSFCTWPSSQVPNYLCSLKSSKRLFWFALPGSRMQNAGTAFFDTPQAKRDIHTETVLTHIFFVVQLFEKGQYFTVMC